MLRPRQEEEEYRPRVREDVKKTAWSSVVCYWLLFIVFGGLLATLRHHNSGALMGQYKDEIIVIGMVAIGICFIIVVHDAFAQNFFHGIFSVCLPGYFLYYLFAVSDAFLLRAIVAALLCGFGADTAGFVMEIWSTSYHTINNWITGKRV